MPELVGNACVISLLASSRRINSAVASCVEMPIISFLLSADCCIYICDAAARSGTRFSLLKEEMFASTLPSSPSMTRRRSPMNFDVLTEIRFLSITQFSLYTLMSVFMTSSALCADSSLIVSFTMVPFLSLNSALNRVA